MAKVQVRFFGPIRRPWQEHSRILEIPDWSDVESLLDAVGFDRNEMLLINVFKNGKRTDLITKLHDGDIVDVTLLVGGG